MSLSLPQKLAIIILLVLACSGCSKKQVHSDLAMAGKYLSANDKVNAEKYVQKAIAKNPNDANVLMGVMLL